MTIRQNLDVNQGETWSWTYTHRDAAGSVVDLTGYSARMSVKSDLWAGNTLYMSSGADALGGDIDLGGVLGTITLSMTAAQTDAMDNTNYFLVKYMSDYDIPFGGTVEFVYDLEIVSPAGVVTRVLQGFFTLYRSVTAP